MRQSETNKDYSGIGTILCAVVALLGFSVLAGWYMHNTRLIQILPGFTPMYYNVALCFIIAGTAAMMTPSGRGLYIFSAGVFVAILGALTLAEHLLGKDFGIDQMFMQDYLRMESFHPGRSAPNTALCFFAIGSVFCLSAALKQSWRFTGAHFLGLFLIANSMSVFVSYLLRTNTGQDLEGLTRMAIHTAGGFFLLGLALIALAWKNQKTHWLSAIVFIVGILFSLQILQILTESDATKNRTAFFSNAQEQSEVLKRELGWLAQTLRAFQAFYEGSDFVRRDEFRAFADTLNIREDELQAVEWMPVVTREKKIEFEKEIQSTGLPEFQIKELSKKNVFKPAEERPVYYPVTYVEPFSTNGSVLGFDRGSEAVRLATLQRAEKERMLISTPPIDLIGEAAFNKRGLLVFAPVFKWESAPDGSSPLRSAQISGYLAAVVQISRFINEAIGDFKRKNLTMMLDDVTDPVARQHLYWAAEGQAAAGIANNLKYRDKFEFAGRKYEIVFYPERNYLSIHQRLLPWAAFFTVLILALGVAFYLDQTVQHNRSISLAKEELKKANDALEKLSVTDPLTEVLNRRGLEQEIARETNFSRRYGGKAYAMLFDLDDFKTINTHYGYHAGDLTLQQITRKIKSVMRPTDFVGRIGGDEFLVLFMHLDSESGVMQAAERIRTAVGELEIRISDEKKIRVTCSAGLTCFAAEATLDGVILAAGRALRQSKDGGKNKLSLA